MSEIETFEKFSRYVDLMASDRIPYPEKLLLELTTRRHPDCKCPLPLTSGVSSDQTDIQVETLEYLQTSLIPYVQELHLAGSGDPILAEEQFISTLTACKEFSVPVTIETHGIGLLDENILQAVLAGPVKKIILTINAPTPESHLDTCGYPLTEVTDVLKRFNELSVDPDVVAPELSLRMVATVRNIELLPEMIDLLQEHSISSLTIVPMSLVEDPDKVSAFRYHRDLTEEVMYRSLIESGISGFELKTEPAQLMDAMGAVNNIEQFLAGQVPPEPDSNQWVRDCSCIWNHAIINVNGHVLPCYGQFPPCGDLTNQSFQEVWFGSQLRTMRQNLLSEGGAAECGTCSHLVWRKLRGPKSVADPEDDSFFRFPGWYGPELDERTFRWTRERAAVFLKKQDHHLFLIMQIRKASIPHAADSGKIIINGSDVHPFSLPGNKWETLELPLPDDTGPDDLVSVEIVPTLSVRPHDVSDASDDTRALGVKVGKVWLESWSKKVVFNKQLILLGYEISPETWEVEGDVVFRTFWRTLAQTESDMKILLDLKCDGSEDDYSPSGEFGKLRVDSLQTDYLLQQQGQSSSNWAPGVFIAQEHRIPLPDNLVAGHYRISIGVYPEGAPRDRLEIVRSDRDHADRLALLGTVLIAHPKH